jgi:hypothetical protein
MVTQPVFTLYLEQWQKRMLADLSSVKRVDRISSIWIKLGKIGCPASYKVPVGGIQKDDWLLYLTDAQMRQVREHLKLRTPITSINVTKEAMKSGAIGFK